MNVLFGQGKLIIAGFWKLKSGILLRHFYNFIYRNEQDFI